MKNTATNKLNVILVEDIPKVCMDDFEYFQSACQSERCKVSSKKSRSNRKELSRVYDKISDQYHVYTLDPHHLFCERKGQCSNTLQKNLLYLDPSPHLTYWAGSLLTSFFEEHFQKNLLLNQPNIK